MGLHSSRAQDRSSRVLPSSRGSQPAYSHSHARAPATPLRWLGGTNPYYHQEFSLSRMCDLGTLMGVRGLAALSLVVCRGFLPVCGVSARVGSVYRNAGRHASNGPVSVARLGPAPHHAVWNSAPFGIPRRLEFRALRDSAHFPVRAPTPSDTRRHRWCTIEASLARAAA